MGVHALCSHPLLPKQTVTWGPSHGVSLRKLPPLHLQWCWVRLSSPRLAMPDGTALWAQQTWGVLCTEVSRLWSWPVPCWHVFLMYQSWQTLCYPRPPSVPALGRSCSLLEESCVMAHRADPDLCSCLDAWVCLLSGRIIHICSQGAQTSSRCCPPVLTCSSGSASTASRALCAAAWLPLVVDTHRRWRWETLRL